MDLLLDVKLADGYRSRSQAARRISEGWFARQMFCPACTSDRLAAVPPGEPVP